MNFSQTKFEEIKAEYEEIIEQLPHYKDINFKYIPISAIDGDNIVNISKKSSWYTDKPLMQQLDTIKLSKRESNDFRMPVQYVNRPHLNFRGFCGTIVSGSINVGNEITVLPSKKSSRVKSIVTNDIKQLSPVLKDETLETIQTAYAPMATTITLEDEIDISRGDMIVKSTSVVQTANKFSVMMIWMNESQMKLNNSYIIKRATSVANGSFNFVEYKKDINTL